VDLFEYRILQKPLTSTTNFEMSSQHQFHRTPASRTILLRFSSYYVFSHNQKAKWSAAYKTADSNAKRSCSAWV